MKFFGPVGYNHGTTETSPGVWEDVIVEKPYYGDVLRNTRKLIEGEKVNNDLSVGNSISIVADAYAYENFHAIRYVKWMGSNWIVSDITVERPRLIFRLGGLYHGDTPRTPSDS